MSGPAALFATGAAADIVLLAMAVELVVLTVAGRDLRTTLALLLPGALIVLALRAALVGAAWPWIAAPLALSLPLHLADLAARLGQPGAAPAPRRSRALNRLRSHRIGDDAATTDEWRIV